MPRLQPKNNRLARWRGQEGLALLAILAIIGLTATLFMVKAVTSAKRRGSTLDATLALAQAQEAIFGFALTNGRLPCPAPPTAPSGTPAAGVALPACIGAGQVGVLPWLTLGLPETDPWGRRYSYRVSASFADAIAAATTTPPANCIPQPPATNLMPLPLSKSSFALCSEGDLTIRTTVGGPTLATLLPGVILSHGPNGFNAYLPSGVRIGSSPDADENANNLTTTTVVSKNPTDTFDDQIWGLDLPLLRTRMIAAGKLLPGGGP